METIEERAREYADNQEQAELELHGLGHVYGYSQIYNSEKVAYERGANEQKAIDDTLIKKLFEKAWSLADSMYQVGKDHLTPLTHQEFIKEMEDIARALNK